MFNRFWRIATMTTAAGAACLSGVAAGCDCPETAEIRVLAAASLHDVVREIAAEFSAEHGGHVRVQSAASSVLARQIRARARCDVFISADAETMAPLVVDGLIDAASLALVARNRLVLAAPPGNPAGLRSLDDLRAPAARRVALCGEAVPLGRYARAVLRTTGNEKLLATAVIVDDARAALAALEHGAVDAAFLYASDARPERVFVVAELHDSQQPAIEYHAGCTPDAGPVAERFLAYLLQPRAQAALARAGLTPGDAAP